MAAVVQFPAIVEELIETFRKVFPDQRTRQHFAEYLTGVMDAMFFRMDEHAAAQTCPPDSLRCA